jgi:hypothetical protein
MNFVAIIYFSGYGHTAKQAEAVAGELAPPTPSARDPRRILDMPLELRVATPI